MATSGMISDEEAGSLYLIDLSSIRLPRQINLVWQILGLASGFSADRSSDEPTRIFAQTLLRKELQIRQELHQSLFLVRREELKLSDIVEPSVTKALSSKKTKVEIE